MNRRLAELRVAGMLLTRLPLGQIEGEAPALAAAGWAFPLWGAVVGALAWAGFAAASACGLPAGIAAVLALGLGVLVTGGLHEDGLADFADGIGGGRDRERRLAIMRDSRIGSYGVLALVGALALRGLAVAEVGTLAAFVAVAAASRFAMLAALAALPPARQEGLGRMAGGADAARLLAGAALAAACLAPLGQGALAVAAVIALAASAVALLAERRIGGQTGDVLGAVQAVSEVAGWLAIAAIASA